MPMKSSRDLINGRSPVERKKIETPDFDDTVSIDLPRLALAAFKELLDELREHWKDRPYPVRDPQQAWGLIGEEWDEFKREVRHTDVGDSLDPLIHDACDIAKIALACYIDLTQVEEMRGRRVGYRQRHGSPARRRRRIKP